MPCHGNQWRQGLPSHFHAQSAINKAVVAKEQTPSRQGIPFTQPPLPALPNRSPYRIRQHRRNHLPRGVDRHHKVDQWGEKKITPYNIVVSPIIFLKYKKQG